jgi:hypothetical protein
LYDHAALAGGRGRDNPRLPTLRRKDQASFADRWASALRSFCADALLPYPLAGRRPNPWLRGTKVASPSQDPGQAGRWPLLTDTLSRFSGLEDS